MEARAPHDFEHDALVPGPGNAEHFSLAFTTWRKMKGGKLKKVKAMFQILEPKRKVIVSQDFSLASP
jgi:hypothetical protein